MKLSIEDRLGQICQKINDNGFYVGFYSQEDFAHSPSETKKNIEEEVSFKKYNNFLHSPFEAVNPHLETTVLYKVDASLFKAFPIHWDKKEFERFFVPSGLAEKLSGIVIVSHKLKMLSFLWACYDPIDKDEELQAKYVSTIFVNWSVIDYKNKIYMPVSEIETACAKVAASSSKLKANALASMLYIYGTSYWQGRLDSACEQYFDIVKDSILSGDFKATYQVFNLVTYANYIRKDYDLAARLLNNIKWFEQYGAATKTMCPYLSDILKNYEPTLSGLRKQYLESVAKNDFQLTTVALAQDKTDSTKEATKSIYSKLKDQSVKLDTALYLNDSDKLIDILMTIDNSIAPDKIEKAIVIINNFDPDFRAADVLKALRVINKKYTLKLYDDRDTWEPILSKVRALIDTYSN